MTLGPFLTAAEQARIAGEIMTWNTELRPPGRFLVRGLGGDTLSLAQNDDDTCEAWARCVSELIGEADYRHALFARVASAPKALEQGEVAELEIQAMPDVDDVTAQLELTDGSAAILAQERHDGFMRLKLSGGEPTSLIGSVRLSGDGLISVPLPLEVQVETPRDAYPQAGSATAPPEEPPPTTAAPESPAALSPPATHVSLDRGALGRLLREADISPLALRLAELIADVADADSALATEAGLVFARAERWQEAENLLNRFDVSSLSRRAVYERFQADCALGKIDDARELLAWLDFESDEAFALLQRSLSFLPDHQRLPLALHLIQTSLSESRSFDLFRSIKERIKTPHDAHEFASAIQYVSEAEALELLTDHSSSDPPDRKLLELLVELALQTPGNQHVGRQIVTLARLRLEADGVDSAFDLQQAARAEGSLNEHFELVEVVASAFAQHQRPDEAVVLLTGEIDAALTAGVPDVGARLANHALSIAAGDSGREELARAAAARAEGALRATEPLRSLLSLQESAQLDATREHTAGRRLVVVGGTSDQAAVGHLRETFGFSDVRWIESEKNKPADIAPLLTMAPKKTIVLVLYERIGHSRSEPVLRDCKTRGITCSLSKLGPRGMTKALLEHNWSPAVSQ
jgi:hypothetical protein